MIQARIYCLSTHICANRLIVNFVFKMRILIHRTEEFQHMRLAGRAASAVLDHVESKISAGITTAEIDKICHDFIIANGGKPACLGYMGFPNSVCTSVNNVVCHGIPTNYAFKDGDIVNVDVVVELNGWHGDTSRTFLIGNVAPETKKLVDVTKKSMDMAISLVKPGATLGDIGHCIQSYVESHGYSVVREYCGHGIGKKMHEDMSVLHYGEKGSGVKLTNGMFFTIEPMVNAGSKEICLLEDGWTVVTADGSMSAQFEHTVGVTKNGFEIFTISS